MKKLLNPAAKSLLLAGALWLVSCQEEYEEVSFSDTDSTSLTATSEAAVLIRNVASFDGSFDNIVDGASCIALQFPYKVIVNGTEIDVSSHEDLHIIEYFFDLSFEDTDVFSIVFPITIKLADYSVVGIDNEEELATFAKECKEGGMDDDIECIDFVYPITLFTFDLLNTQTGTVEVEDDEQLYQIFGELGTNDLVSIDYPLTLAYSYGTGSVQVSSNEVLTMTLHLARGSCDEDDDNNYNDDDFGNFAEELGPLLTSCSWQVRSVKRDGVDLTSQYETYAFNFTGGDYSGWGPEPILQVSEGGESRSNGVWVVNTNDKGEATLGLSVSGNLAFNGVWSVFKGTYGVWDLLVLYDGEDNRLELRKGCHGFNDYSPEDLAHILRECGWVIGNDFSQGEEIKRRLGYEFEFQAEGVVTLSSPSATTTGTWEVSEDDNGRLVLVITIGDAPGVSLQWILRIREDHQLIFDNPEAGNYDLQLLRVCIQNGGKLNESEYLEAVRTTLRSGEWQVASYTEGDVDLTGQFDGYNLSFGGEHLLMANSDIEPVKEGLWRVMVDASDFIYRTVYINLGVEDDLFVGLTAVWTLEEYMENSFTENRIILYRYGTDNTRIELVLEK